MPLDQAGEVASYVGRGPRRCAHCSITRSVNASQVAVSSSLMKPPNVGSPENRRASPRRSSAATAATSARSPIRASAETAPYQRSRDRPQRARPAPRSRPLPSRTGLRPRPPLDRRASTVDPRSASANVSSSKPQPSASRPSSNGKTTHETNIVRPRRALHGGVVDDHRVPRQCLANRNKAARARQLEGAGCRWIVDLSPIKSVSRGARRRRFHFAKGSRLPARRARALIVSLSCRDACLTVVKA